MINVSTIGLKTLQRRVRSARQKLSNTKKTNAKAVILVDRWVQNNFKSEGQPVGGWAPLKQSTIDRRRTGKKARKGSKILQDTGQLKTRWKHFYNDHMGRVTSNVPYAVYHDSDEPRSKLPRRQILPDEKHISKDLEKLYGRFVKTSLNRSDL